MFRHFISSFRYGLWPVAKVRLRYWWWIVRFRGKKNIPRDLVFGEMKKSMERMRENLQKALQALPSSGASREEIMALSEALRKANALDDSIAEMKDGKSDA